MADDLTRTARGLMLGLMLGNAVGAANGKPPATGALRVTTVTQLACFSVEGAIRASVRMAQKGVCDPAGVVWHAYVRWAALQGINAETVFGQWREWADSPWPDGWLGQVPVLSEKRGSAPSTVAAIQAGRPGGRERPATASAGSHAVTRTLPLGLLQSVSNAHEFAGDVAALSHAGSAIPAAISGAGIVRAIAAGAGLHDAVQAAHDSGAGSPAVERALQAVRRQARDPAALRDLAGDRSAVAVLAAGIYAAMSFSQPNEAADAITFAARAADSPGAAAVAGAIAGAVHGPDVWPVPWLSRVELVWVVDVLARDLVREVTETPGGYWHESGGDRSWLENYPGW